MKKYILAAAIVGLVVTPTLVMARQGADDANQGADVRQEDRQEDRREDRQDGRRDHRQEDDRQVSSGEDRRGDGTIDDNPTGNETFVETPSGTVKVETEANLPASSISLSEATAIAQSTLSGRTVEKVEVEEEHGATVYSVRFTDDSRVDVRASDGQVTRVRED